VLSLLRADDVLLLPEPEEKEDLGLPPCSNFLLCLARFSSAAVSRACSAIFFAFSLRCSSAYSVDASC